MTTAEQEEWQAHNDRYLAAALEWLRLLLHRRVAEVPRTAGEPGRPTAPGSGKPGRRPGGRRPGGDVPDDDGELSAARDAMERAAAAEPPPALVRLGGLLALSAFEQHTLLLCTAPEMDPGIADLCARAQGDPALPYPTFALALSLFPDPAWDVLSPYRGLRYWKLVEVDRSAGQALVTSPLCADERIVNHLRGLDYLDDRLEPLVTLVSPETAPGDPTGLPASQQASVEEAVSHWRQSPGPGHRLPVIQLLGPDRESKRSVAARTAETTGLLLYVLPAVLLPEAAADLDAAARLWQRETLLLPLALLLDTDDETGEGGADASRRMRRFLDRSGGPCMVATRESRPELAVVTAGVDIAPPPPGERAAAWRTVLPPEEADRLAGQFALDLPTIHEITAASGPDPEAAWRACRARTRPRLGPLAQRLEPRVGWDDIVLPAQETELLRQIADQVAQRNTVYHRWGFGERVKRGLGISVLFTGPSGTGKTMAAEVLARHLRLDLYRVDLSAAVSKYIGETEKNLRRLFDAAEPGGAILLFDEADALFGKRSDVKDSHDRYANIEVSYLLQRMEAYRGLAVLATNQRRALDTAFLRRLRFIVPFGFPGPEERRAMWERAFPAHAPVNGLDSERLAVLPLSGGMIRNIALNAAFAAASAGVPIGMPMVLAAARAELRKLEMPVSEADFCWDGQPGMPEMSA
ncbi:ATP-binding protein [Streptomyces roseoverticillatus]|uniref:ATP-binding protein n=1 Tax=Streptomyces roseoverticillatus TaxID=66429 RepID=UPI001F1A3DD8|nr:ATP-binding protein [Streptomyces roseoverticillatus]MCF3101830.1 ATP-binding protein [Streptomyces roseoverticillatus]